MTKLLVPIRLQWRGHIEPLHIAAYITWAAVAFNTLRQWLYDEVAPTAAAVLGVVALLAVLGFFTVSSLNNKKPGFSFWTQALVLAEIPAALLAYWGLNNTLVLALLVIVAVQLASMYWLLATALLLLATDLFLLSLVAERLGWGAAGSVVLAYGAFQGFAVVTTTYAKRAERAHAALLDINAELLATRHLLLESALAEDHGLVLQGLRALLEKLGGITVAIEAEDGVLLLKALARTPVDVVVADARMPRQSGIEAVRVLRARGDYTPVIVVTTFDDPRLLQDAVQAGAQGFLLKDAEPEELKTAIERVAAGEMLLSPLSLSQLRRRVPAAEEVAAHLTPRELTILRFVAGGYSNKAIGRALNISDGTVKNHMSEIMQKLEARDRTHAVFKAIATRLL